MAFPLLNQRDIEFMLYELFDSESLIQRERYAEHSRETFSAAIRTAIGISEKYFLPYRQKVDTNQPGLESGKVHLIAEIGQANNSLIESGLLAATSDYEHGGMQLPLVIAAAAMAFPTAANTSFVSYALVTSWAANLINAHGSDQQKTDWLPSMWSGRFAGTMAMTEPGAGSGLADLCTSAVKTQDGEYRITGNKIFISGGDHDLNQNIVHLVLARIRGAPKGIKGISLFIVPKFVLNKNGSIGDKNDIVVSGLFHKMGGRGHVNTALNFGENGGAIGYLVGEENRGLTYMFHMMNEARITVGTNAATLGLAGYQYSLEYAKTRPQGRLPSNKNPLGPPVNIIEHADVRRMLLAQKAYAEASFALCLLGNQLMDDEQTAPAETERIRAKNWLDFLTPIIKSWPSKFATRANYYAIQILAGHGYTTEHPVEMFYRDNRLNSIHEGTHGIQSLDLLSRKLIMNDMAGHRITIEEMEASLAQAQQLDKTREFAQEFSKALKQLTAVTERLVTAMKEINIDLALANSAKYLDLYGHVIAAWMWLRQGIISARALEKATHTEDINFYKGKLCALQYFFRFELPEIYVWAELLNNLDDTTYSMDPEWF